MKVFFDSQIFQLQKYGGISRYFTELISSIKSIDPKTEIRIGTRFIRNEYLISLKGLGVKESPRFMPMKMLLKLDSRRKISGNVDLIHTTYYQREFLPKKLSIPNLITVHDMIPEDIGKFSPTDIHISDKAKFIENADGIICVSKFTKERLVSHFPGLGIPVSVIPLATNLPNCFPVNHDLSSVRSRNDNFIYIGPRGGYKNFQLLLFAAVRLRSLTNRRFKIVAVGGGKFSEEEKSQIVDLDLDGFVVQVEMDDFKLSQAYSTSRALIYPSMMEGFGIPQIEAFSFGCAVISSGLGALKEFDNGIALIFDAHSPEALANRMLETLNISSSAFSDLAGKAIDHSKNFSWAETAQKTLDFYKIFV